MYIVFIKRNTMTITVKFEVSNLLATILEQSTDPILSGLTDVSKFEHVILCDTDEKTDLLRQTIVTAIQQGIRNANTFKEIKNGKD